jgi:hypothetical protein
MTPKLALALTWMSFAAAAAIGYAVAQQTAPSEIQGCIVVGSAPTLTAGVRTTFTCNTSGQLRMSTTP